MTDGPLIVQSDKTLLLEVDHPRRAGARARRSPRSPSWSARPSTSTPTGSPRWRCGTRAPPGHDAEQVVDALVRFSRYAGAAAAAGRHRRHDGPLRPAAAGQRTRCTAWSWSRWTGRCSRRCCGNKKIAPMLGARIDDDTVVVHPSRARPPQAGAAQGRLARRGPRRLRRRRGAPDRAATRTSWHLRDYQEEAVEGFWAGGSGVVVLPCGAGKTLVGAAAMAKAQARPR